MASAMITRGMVNATQTMTGPRQLGKKWRHSRRRFEAPMQRAASMYCDSLIDSTAPRTSRAAPTQLTAATATISIATPPSQAPNGVLHGMSIIRMQNMMLGKA
jgi:hypothetical protein